MAEILRENVEERLTRCDSEDLQYSIQEVVFTNSPQIINLNKLLKKNCFKRSTLLILILI